MDGPGMKRKASLELQATPQVSRPWIMVGAILLGYTALGSLGFLVYLVWRCFASQ